MTETAITFVCLSEIDDLFRHTSSQERLDMPAEVETDGGGREIVLLHLYFVVFFKKEPLIFYFLVEIL